MQIKKRNKFQKVIKSRLKCQIYYKYNYKNDCSGKSFCKVAIAKGTLKGGLKRNFISLGLFAIILFAEILCIIPLSNLNIMNSNSEKSYNSDNISNLNNISIPDNINNYFPFGSKYSQIQNNGTYLNVTALSIGNGSYLDQNIYQSIGGNIELPVPNSSIITGMNFTLKNPKTINSSIIIVNDTLATMPNYTISYENKEFINDNATFIIEANSTPYFPLGTISIYTNSSGGINANDFYLNFTGNGIHEFNITSDHQVFLNITIYFYYENNSIYSQESVIVEFYSQNLSVIKSPLYYIEYTPSIYTNTTGLINITAINGNSTSFGNINITINNTLVQSYFGQGNYVYYISNFKHEIKEISVLFYTALGKLYANETFAVEFKDPLTNSFAGYSYGEQYYNISYDTEQKTTYNATITINSTNTANYTHGSINFTITGDDFNNAVNQTSMGVYSFNVSRNTIGTVNIVVDFYNNSAELNDSINFNINFYNYSVSNIWSVNYSISYPQTYYINHNATIDMEFNDGTNLTLGNIDLFVNGQLNNTFGGAGTYSTNITANQTESKNIMLLLNYSNPFNFNNESFNIDFIVKPSYYGQPITKNDSIPDSGFNKTSIEPPLSLNERAISMQFAIAEPINITGFTLFSSCEINWALTTGSLIIELREGNYEGNLINSQPYTLVNFPNPDWHFYAFPLTYLNAGIYTLVINGTQLNTDILNTFYDYFIWYKAPGDSSPHNATYKQFPDNPWADVGQDFLMKINCQKWDSTNFNQLNVSATAGSLTKYMQIVDENTSIIIFNENEGPWPPLIDGGNYSIHFNSNITTKLNILYNVSFNTTQNTDYASFQIQNTSNSQIPIVWNVRFSGSAPISNYPEKMEIKNYHAVIHMPQFWYSINGSSISYSENFGNNKNIMLNNTAVQESWNFEAFSDVRSSSIFIIETQGLGTNDRGVSDNVTVGGSVSNNSRIYYANLTIWHNDTLLFQSNLTNDSVNFVFDTWTIPNDAEKGTYEAFYYWSNGTDVAFNSINFSVKYKAELVPEFDYAMAYYQHNVSINFTFRDYVTKQPINDGIIKTNWTTGLWSYTIESPNGIYTLQLNTTGIPKGTRKDIMINISSSFYKNETLIYPIYILMNTSLIINPNYDTLYPEVNQTIEFEVRYYSEIDIYGIKNISGSANFSAKIDNITIPISIQEINEQYDNYFIISLNLSLYPQLPQAGQHMLIFNFIYKNQTICYEPQKKQIILNILPQRSYININSTSSFKDGDFYHLYDFIGTPYSEIIINASRRIIEPDTIIYTPLTNANASAVINSSALSQPIKISLTELSSQAPEFKGFYKLNFEISTFKPNTLYFINITLRAIDIEEVSVLIQFQLIQKMQVVIEFNKIPRNIKEFSNLPISGTIYILNNSEYQPLKNTYITIRISYSGIKGNEIEEYKILTSNQGTFSLTNITAPNSEDYLSIVITVIVEESRYYLGQEAAQGTKIYRFSTASTILIILASIALGMAIMFAMLRYLMHRRRIKAELYESELDLPISRKKRRQNLKQRLENYIRIPSIKAEPEELLYKLPPPTKDVNILIVPPDVDEKSRKKYSIQLPIQLFHEEEEFINKDIFLYKKERYLNAAIKHENLNNLEIAAEYYEKAAFMADKLGEFNESKTYLKKAEEIENILKQKYKKETAIDELNIVKFFKQKFRLAKDEKLQKGMKKASKELKEKLTKARSTSKIKTTKTSKKTRSKTITSKKTIKRKLPKKIKSANYTKHVQIPLVNRKKLQKFKEELKKLDEL
ncbi:MAG: hypothetical protein ACTSRZ_14815 [Promethearchaeota archaeon]